MKRALALLSFAVCTGPLAAAEPAAKADSAKGQSIASKICAACHGADGNSPTPANPKLAGQVPECLQKQLANFKPAAGKRAERENPIMGGMVAGLSVEDMRDVAAYYRSEEHTSELQSHHDLVCRLLLEKKKKKNRTKTKGGIIYHQNEARLI